MYSNSLYLDRFEDTKFDKPKRDSVSGEAIKPPDFTVTSQPFDPTLGMNPSVDYTDAKVGVISAQ